MEKLTSIIKKYVNLCPQSNTYSNVTKKRKLAFTLAEVLITLGIIGIVAAITIPQLINNYKAKRLRTQFLKSYSTIQQAFKEMEADDVSTDPTTYNTLEYYKTFMNYLQAPMVCGIGNNKYPPCVYMRDSSSKDYKPYKTYDGKTNASMILFDDGQIALQDGTLLLFENYAPRMRVFVSVDLNGYNNKPNRWGYDLFTFQLVDNQLKAMGDTGTTYTDLSTYCNVNSQDEYNGIACAKKALSDSEYFKNIVKEFK
ncbi:TPA: hypothetical protein CPT78_03555 [Candidatus Gastranaerophilales bacterium HUM_14]|nr:MAG TPA: hypothetical protein CPT78_03555 [Candidatus Gastranaerophilales bacterium HUM_14]